LTDFRRSGDWVERVPNSLNRSEELICRFCGGFLVGGPVDRFGAILRGYPIASFLVKIMILRQTPSTLLFQSVSLAVSFQNGHSGGRAFSGPFCHFLMVAQK
jgi:hypothetical protein